MKVKVGDTIYDPEDVFIMVILNEGDKFNISHMEPEATKYASFNPEKYTTLEVEELMKTP